MMPKLDDYLKITEAAEFLGVCKNTLRNWEASGKLEVYRNPMNGYRLYKKDHLEELLTKIEQPEATTKQNTRSKPR